MFSTLGLFKGLPCPGRSDCSLGNCLFSHDIRPKDDSVRVKEQVQTEISFDRAVKTSPAKVVPDRTKGTTIYNRGVSRDQPHEDVHAIKTTPAKEPQREARVAIDLTTKTKPNSLQAREPTGGSRALPSSTKKPPAGAVSIGQSKDVPLASKVKTPASQTPKAELLQPRTLPNPPASHPVRFKLLQLVHEQMDRLNKLVIASSEPSTQALRLSKQELITMALDEEQNTAKSNSKVYTNVMKNRVGTLKKADLKVWAIERTAQIQKQAQSQETMSKKRKFAEANERVATGMTNGQETAVLNLLVSTQSALKAHGYIMEVPSEADIAKADAGIKLANSWEVCDRCGCRFQAFPTRRESDGVLTTGGSCRHHWGRLIPQPRGSSSKPIYTCCQLEQGQPGCEEKPTHVFKVSSASRLASVLQFEETPSPEDITPRQPVCFDCEMAYTSYGMELIRLTATAWPSGNSLLDILVRPRGEVLDLNTRFSGVTVQQWTQAEQWSSNDLPTIDQPNDTKRIKSTIGSDTSTSKAESASLPIVPSIQHARELFFKLITPSTPLIGHALENDLIALRIVHSAIVDTVILFPHKKGLPLRNKLKFLARDEIHWTIQESGSDGHDSLEDALAAGELVRHKVRVKWATLERAGWRFVGDTLCSPESKIQ